MKKLYEVTLIRRVEQVQRATVNVEAVTEEEARSLALLTPYDQLEWSEAIKDLPNRELKTGEVEVLAELSE